MEADLLKILVTAVLASVGSWAAVRINIQWIVKTLERHEKYHDEHFKEFDNIYKRSSKNVAR